MIDAFSVDLSPCLGYGRSIPLYESATNGDDIKDTNNNDEQIGNRSSIDVSHLGLTMEDLNKPLPSEMLDGIASSGYESTSRLPDVDDNGCSWTENGEDVNVVLVIPGLRGQPASSLACELGTYTATVTAFGMVIWSCIMRGEVKTDSGIFTFQEGDDMVPVIEMSVKKARNERWGGFIAQIGENSIL